VNFLAHCIVAERTGPGTVPYDLGAVLSDLCSMAGLRFAFDRLPGAVAAGVSCHRVADRVFHADPEFLAGARAIRAGASSAGLPPGASRAVGHVGWELLLDGTPAVAGAAGRFEAALGESASVVPAFAPGDAQSWLRLADRLAADRFWTRYDDPEVVARRLFGLLGRRPRLAFGRDALGAAASVMAASRPMVLAGADSVVERVVQGVLADRDRARAPRLPSGSPSGR
jgi:acyl carrier protein phosphodiesterase